MRKHSFGGTTNLSLFKSGCSAHFGAVVITRIEVFHHYLRFNALKVDFPRSEFHYLAVVTRSKMSPSLVVRLGECENPSTCVRCPSMNMAPPALLLT